MFAEVWNSISTAATYFAFAMTLSALRRASIELAYEQEHARTDSGTGVANRRWFYEKAEREVERAKKNAAPLTVAYLDLDGVKQINDQCGHDIGDDMLREVGAILSKESRAFDPPARMGGDEFILLLPEIDIGTARQATDRIVVRLVDASRRNTWSATISAGTVRFLRAALTTDELVWLADPSMYSTKRGKNRIEYQTVETWYPGKVLECSTAHE